MDLRMCVFLIAILLSCFGEGFVDANLNAVARSGELHIETSAAVSENGTSEVVTPYSLETTTTPPCTYDIRCGFQEYEDYQRRTPIREFLKYCDCVNGTVCLPSRDHMSGMFYYYKCQNVTEPATDSATSNASQVGRAMSLLTAEDRIGFLQLHDEL